MDVIPPRILAIRTLLALGLVFVIVYFVDSLYFRLRMIHPKPGDPLETLTAARVLAIPERGNKTSYEIDQQNPEQTVTCVHALFLHSGYSPCWYVKPRINQPIPM